MGFEALEMLRIEAGLILGGNEFSDETDPFEAGIAFTVPLKTKEQNFIGREALIETSLLSKCDGLIYVTSNIASAAIAWNLNKSQKQFKIDNGINSKNLILSNFLWLTYRLQLQLQIQSIIMQLVFTMSYHLMVESFFFSPT